MVLAGFSDRIRLNKKRKEREDQELRRRGGKEE